MGGGLQWVRGDDTVETTLGALALAYTLERERRRELRPGSITTQRHALSTFVRSAGWDLPVKRLKPSHVEKWMERGDHSPATLRNQLSILRGFCRWLVKRGHTKADPTLDIAAPRQPRYLPRGLPLPKVASALDASPDTRATLILSLMVQEGLRCCEVSSLELGDVDPTERLILVRGKGGHERVLPVSDETTRALAAYLTEHPARVGPVIRSYSRPGRGIGARHISALVSAWLHDSGADATAHALRHTAATDMLRAGAHVRDVQNALGHQSLATTQRYMPWVVGDLRKAMGGRTYKAPEPPAAATGDDAA